MTPPTLLDLATGAIIAATTSGADPAVATPADIDDADVARSVARVVLEAAAPNARLTCGHLDRHAGRVWRCVLDPGHEVPHYGVALVKEGRAAVGTRIALSTEAHQVIDDLRHLIQRAAKSDVRELDPELADRIVKLTGRCDECGESPDGHCDNCGCGCGCTPGEDAGAEVAR